MNTKLFLTLLVSLFIHALAYQTISVNRGSLLLNQFSPLYDARMKISSPSSEMFMYYAWFASMSYCEKAHITAGVCCQSILNNNWSMIDYGYDPNQGKYNYVLLRSDVYQKFVFAFPGTRGPAELATEIALSYLTSYRGSSSLKVVEYFRKRADGILNLAFSKANLDQIKAAVGYQVIFTGHSLGGAVATIMALNSVYLNKINPLQNEPVLITFGQPRTGNYDFANEVNRRLPKIFRVVRNGDLVSHVPPCLNNIFTGHCIKSSITYFHIGGLHLMNRDMTSIAICPRSNGEELDGNCDNGLSLDSQYHLRYFNQNSELAKYCKPQNNSEEDEELEQEYLAGYLSNNEAFEQYAVNKIKAKEKHSHDEEEDDAFMDE